MSIKRIVIAAVILLLTAVSVGSQPPQSPEDLRRTPTRARYIFPVALVPLNGDAIQPDPGRILGLEARIRY